MSALRTIKLLLAGIAFLLAGATIYTSVLVSERQEVLRNTSRYNIVWLVSQATTELARFVERATAYGVPGSNVDAEEVQLRYEILLNRLQLFQSGGDFAEFAAADPEHEATVAALRQALAKAGSLVEHIDEPGAGLALRALLGPLDTRLARLAAGANSYSGDQTSADQRELLSLHWQFSALVFGLILCGLVMMGLLVWHNHLLGSAGRKLAALADHLGRTSEQLNAALNNMSQGLCMVDKDQRLTVCNAQFVALLALPPEAATPGRAMSEVFDAEYADLTVSRALSEDHRRLVVEGRAGSYLQDLQDGRTLSISHQPMAGGGWVATYEDVTERRQAEARIAYLAHHDVLTDLPNRVLFLQRLEGALARVERHDDTLAILSIDLDRFKSVNDTLGHPAGDALLGKVADRLRACLRDTDTVARLGGDEFAILQVGREQPRDANRLARRIAEVIAAPYDLDGNEVVIGTSIGIAVAPHDGLDPAELLKGADMALYRAKADGRGTHRFFEAAMDAELQTRRALELDLRQALVRGEFDLYYQSLVDLRTDEIVGYEALLRWHHPERGIVSPADFVPVAEEIGLISAIGEWVIRRACHEAACWPSSIKVAVNLSSVQFRGRGLVPAVVSALVDSGLPAQRLELEITESVLLHDNEVTVATLHQLRGLGARIAMDDFGTGFSSLSYLRSFPFDKIKIDRSFVHDSERVDCMAIIRSVASLAANLSMSTTAEGIETPEQLERVRAAGCTEGQGYLFSRPKPFGELIHSAGALPAGERPHSAPLRIAAA